MNSIAKIHLPIDGVTDRSALHPSVLLWTHPATGLLARIAGQMLQRDAHPARTLVLLPYAQLLPLAARLWAQCYPDGFAPQFETTLNWSTSLGDFRPGATDIAFDMALDSLTAGALLRGAGLGDKQNALASLLVQAAHQLGPLAAACHPGERVDWAQQARRAALIGLENPALAAEAAVARIAVEWAAQSAYASDIVFGAQAQVLLDCLVVVRGLAAEPLLAALQRAWGERLASLALIPDVQALCANSGSTVAWHACVEAEDEAQRAAACAIRHVVAGRIPLAFVSTDRALTRRVRSMLESADIQIRDETGWKLSTSHAAAQIMALLKACVWNASADVVLAWLKIAPNFGSAVGEIETALRKDQCSDWGRADHGLAVQASPAALQLLAEVNGVRAAVKGSRTLAAWLAALRHALQTSGMWDGLQMDGPGTDVLSALRLAQPAMPAWESLLEQALWSGQRMDLAEFTHWVNQALEGASFSPEYPAHEQVVFLPMSQMLARPFPAVVLAGCDEVRLNPSPEPPGGWTVQQRAALGLPSREDLQAVASAAWLHALQTPVCDVLWRCSDDSGEILLPSALVQRVQLERSASLQADDPRQARTVTTVPVQRPKPDGRLIPVQSLSASAYEDLRTCPYRFFAMRQLGLRSVDELDAMVDKRDFGLWLHDVLKRFHEALAHCNQPSDGAKRSLLDDASLATTQSMGLADGEFLPFAAAWPAVREGYLRWLVQHQAHGAAFASAETAHSQGVGPVKLVGRVDRTDTLPGGEVLVLDYKTENAAKTASRIKEPLEDTQIAFYAALLPNDTLQGAYVNVGEREGTKTYTQSDIVEARDALIAGVLHDMERIAHGAPMQALGDGTACDFCQARGLCRKDFWT
jgi:ATP-dependent helicase/nuclease subunit B